MASSVKEQLHPSEQLHLACYITFSDGFRNTFPDKIINLVIRTQQPQVREPALRFQCGCSRSNNRLVRKSAAQLLQVIIGRETGKVGDQVQENKIGLLTRHKLLQQVHRYAGPDIETVPSGFAQQVMNEENGQLVVFAMGAEQQYLGSARLRKRERVGNGDDLMLDQVTAEMLLCRNHMTGHPKDPDLLQQRVAYMYDAGLKTQGFNGSIQQPAETCLVEINGAFEQLGSVKRTGFIFFCSCRHLLQDLLRTQLCQPGN